MFLRSGFRNFLEILLSVRRRIGAFAPLYCRSTFSTSISGIIASPTKLRRNHEFLADLNLIGIRQLIAIRLEDPVVIVCVAVELLCDLRKRIAGLHFVSTRTAATCRRSCGLCFLRRERRIYGEVAR